MRRPAKWAATGVAAHVVSAINPKTHPILHRHWPPDGTATWRHTGDDRETGDGRVAA